jgi:hypothetical protein
MGIGGPAQKNGGGEKGLDWCMTKAGVGTLEYRIRLMSFPQEAGKGEGTKSR